MTQLVRLAAETDVPREVAKARARKRASAAGFGFPFSFWKPSTIDPTLLTASGFWRDYPGALTWSGTASAGTSSTHTFSTSSSAPTAGTALNGHGTAAFNGSSNFADANAALSGFWSSGSTIDGAVLLKVNSIATNNAGSSDNDSILCSSGSSFFYLYLRSGGGSPVVGLGIFNGTANVAVETAISTGAYQLVHFQLSGGTLLITVNGGTTATQGSAGSISSLGSTFETGKSTTGTRFLNGTIAEVIIGNNLFGGTITYAQYRAYCNGRYGVSV